MQAITWHHRHPQTTQGVALHSLPPLALYIHFPWCEKKCPYCDFNSHEAQHFDEALYLKALEYDLIQTLPSIWGRKIHSIFMGGGTPSLISGKGMAYFMQTLRALLPLSADIEVTIEANPASAMDDKLQAYADSGINRISLGVQSFNADHLQHLGRIHDPQQAKNAITSAQRYFSRVNIDLMYALPQQNLQQAIQDLNTALSFGTEHISYYQLTLEPNTVFAKYPPALPPEDTLLDIEDSAYQTLASKGYQRYEVSAFAQTDKTCQHNVNYWQFGDYIGIGAGAHGKISTADGVYRTVKYRTPESYLEKFQQQQTMHSSLKWIAAADLPFEFMLNALRLTQGVPRHYFSERTGLPYAYIEDKVAQGITENLLLEVPHMHDGQKMLYLQTTAHGLNFLNTVQSYFL